MSDWHVAPLCQVPAQFKAGGGARRAPSAFQRTCSSAPQTPHYMDNLYRRTCVVYMYIIYTFMCIYYIHSGVNVKEWKMVKWRLESLWLRGYYYDSDSLYVSLVCVWPLDKCVYITVYFECSSPLKKKNLSTIFFVLWFFVIINKV